MPNAGLDVERLRDELREPDNIERDPFRIVQDLCRLTASSDDEGLLRELSLRAMEHRDRFGPAARVLDGLLRHTGLFPYLSPDGLSVLDRLALEVHRPSNLDDIVFHRSQAAIYRRLLDGKNVALSAPTSFGKSLIIDALIATGRYSNVAIVVPTVALIDETRRRLTQRFANRYKVVTHASQSLAQRNLFVLTQERVLEFTLLPELDFFVVDEFYKLTPGRDDDDRCALLNHALYLLLKQSKQFYMLGPFIVGLSESFQGKFSCEFIKEDFHTVVSEIHRVTPSPRPIDTLVELCRTLTDPTIVFCSSPKRAAEVAVALCGATLGLDASAVANAAAWVAATYHPGWHFARALAHGIGVHHGRVPRALGQYVIRQFNSGGLQFLVCTSTLIEGVNTRAKNIIVLDKTINRANIDLFTFNNIRGRAGRMRQHFIGHVYVFHNPPQMGLPFVDVPAFSQNENAPDSLLVQIADNDLSQSASGRVGPFRAQSELSFETIRANVGIDPTAQIEVARRLSQMGPLEMRMLAWSGLPTYDQLKLMCTLIWNSFDGRRLGSGSVVSAEQLTLFVNRLRTSPAVSQLIQQAMQRSTNADQGVQQIVDFLRLWAMFHFPRLLRAIDKIQREVLTRLGKRPGSYEFFAGRVECLFLDSALVALDEYGVPLETARTLRMQLGRNGNLDETLAALRNLDVEHAPISDFEKELLRDAQLYV